MGIEKILLTDYIMEQELDDKENKLERLWQWCHWDIGLTHFKANDWFLYEM